MSKAHPRSAEELARIFFEFGYWYEMNDVAFKPRAYQLASESVSGLGKDIETTWRDGGINALKQLPGIGASTAEKIDEYFRTGTIEEYDAFKKKFPVDIWELSRIEGLGPKHIKDLYTVLKVRNLKDLHVALKNHRVRTIPRWGEKSEEKLARGLGLLEAARGRLLLGHVLPVAESIVTSLSKIVGVTHCEYAGSLRRRQDTIGDIDLIVTTSNPKSVIDAFVSLPQVTHIHERGKTRASVRLSIGIDADLRVVADDAYGAVLQYFTGDKRHNVMLRELALSKGYTLNEYGLFRRTRTAPGTTSKQRTPVACRTEGDIYHALGMQTPPPELRVGDQEIQAARAKTLPTLLPYGAVRGDLQVQTSWTDGAATIDEMARAAKNRGLSYIAITDHTKALAFIDGLNDSHVAKQIREIQSLNKKRKEFRIFTGTECDILKDGALDLADATLAKLEWVGVSIHSHFNLSRATQTTRLVNAISNPNVDCVFHPTCRLIGKREPIDIDIDEVIAAAKKYRVALEINAYPERSDLRDIYVHAAIRAGVKLVINTDAHATDHFDFLPLGEAIARRGWATKKDILNTKTATQLLAYLTKKRKRS